MGDVNDPGWMVGGTFLCERCGAEWMVMQARVLTTRTGGTILSGAQNLRNWTFQVRCCAETATDCCAKGWTRTVGIPYIRHRFRILKQTCIFDKVWPHRLAVRTGGFQSPNAGSNPAGVTTPT